MFNIRKIIFAGVGLISVAAKKADHAISQAFSEGARVKEKLRQEGEEALRDVGEDLKKFKSEAAKFLASECKKVISKLDLATKEEIDQLSQRISNLETRLFNEIKKN